MKKNIIIGILCIGLFFGWRLYDPAPAIRNASPAGEHIICFGDSLTYGTGSTEDMDYPSRLSEPVINAGGPEIPRPWP